MRREELDAAIVLEPTGPGRWRVCDGRVGKGPGRLLALVDSKNGECEVMQFAEQFIWSTFPTLRDALGHIVATHPAVVAARTSGAPGWF